MTQIEIIKSSGEKQVFSREKLEKSIRLAGASEGFAREIVDSVLASQKEFKSTSEIIDAVYGFLREKYSPLAARYNLKSAIEQLGPTGFPFEKFVAEVFNRSGYKAETNQVISGKCVDHEVDVVLTSELEKNYVEVKFHHKKWVKSDVKTVLYVKARVDDILSVHCESEKKAGRKCNAWVITNTEFTLDAAKYGECQGIRMISWSRPNGWSLHDFINKLGIHPVTALTMLSGKEKATLTQKGVLLCRDVKKNLDVLKSLGMDQEKIERVLKEAEAIHLLKNSFVNLE